MRLDVMSDAELEERVAAAERTFDVAIGRAMRRASEALLVSTRTVTAAVVSVDPDDAIVMAQVWDLEVPGLAAELRVTYGASANGVAAQLVALAPVGGLRTFTAPSALALDELGATWLAGATNRLRDVGVFAWAQIRDELYEAFVAGESVDRMTARLEDVAGMSRRRARTVARTETIAARNAGAFQAAGLYPELEPRTKTWSAANDARTRATHAAADGQTVGFREKFQVGGFSADRPHDPALPASESVNCFAGDQRVEWVGDLRRLIRRWYPGPLLKFATANGIGISVTPNHPLLTPAGWAAAQTVCQGDYLIHAGDGVPHVDDVPASIEEVYRAASKKGPMRRIGGRRVDFHGDGADGEVEVVGADSDLLAVLDAENIHVGRELDFVGLDRRPGDFSAAGRWLAALLCPGGLGVGDTDRTPIRLVCRGSKIPAFIGGHTGHSDPVGFAAGADGQSQFRQSSDYEWAAHVEGLGDGEDARPVVVELTQVIHVEVLAGGHWVYNLSSSTELLVCNGIVASNCRCTLLLDVDD